MGSLDLDEQRFDDRTGVTIARRTTSPLAPVSAEELEEVGSLPGLPLFLFLLWELPGMIAMSAHKLWCAATGGSLQTSFRGVWFYRIVGMFTVWTTVMVLIGLSGSGASGLVGALLPLALIGVPGLILWARFSSKGA